MVQKSDEVDHTKQEGLHLDQDDLDVGQSRHALSYSCLFRLLEEAQQPKRLDDGSQTSSFHACFRPSRLHDRFTNGLQEMEILYRPPLHPIQHFVYHRSSSPDPILDDLLVTSLKQ